MVVDYSKWDKLELSDDSDVEVHPNVDKASFIRWKQRDIHEKREQARQRTEQLEANIELNGGLLARMKQLKAWADNGGNLKDVNASISAACKGFESNKPANAGPMEPTFREMLLDLIGSRISDDITKGSSPQERLINITKEVSDRLDKEKQELEILKEERSRHINSDDLKFGWDSTMVNKEANTEPSRQSATPASASSSASKSAETSVEVLNPNPSPSSSKVQDTDDPDNLDPSPDAQQFAQIAPGEYEKAFNFLMGHKSVVNEREKDALMMVAFQQQLEGKTDEMKRTVHNALLIQYCATLGADGIRMFFSKITKSGHPALAGFLKDVDFTVNHIKTRCDIIAKEREEEGEEVEQIQLHSADPNTKIVLAYPEEDDVEAHKLIASLPEALQAAIATGSLDEINKVLGNMELPAAEKAVEIISESGLLQLESKVYDKDEWEQKMKDEQTGEGSVPGTIEELD